MQHYPTIKQSFGILIFIITAIIPTILALFLLMEEGWIELELSQIVFIGYLFPMALSTFVFIKETQKKSDHTFKLNIKKIHPQILIPIIIISIAFFIFIHSLTSLLPEPSATKEIGINIYQYNIYIFFFTLILAPLFEEIIFRGIILKGFLKNYSPKKAILWSAFLFAIIHLSISTFLLGLFIGWIYHKTRSLTPCFLIHSLCNLGGFLLLSPALSSNDSGIFHLNMIGFMVVALISGFIIFWGIKVLNTKFAKSDF